MKQRRQLLDVLLAVGLIFAILAPSVLAGPPSDDIKDLFIGENALAHIAALVSFGPRVAGGPAEDAAAEYIAAQMRSYGLDVEIQEFPQLYYEDLGSTLEVVGGPTLTPRYMRYSPPGEVTAEIVDCGYGNYSTDFPAEVAGKIALIKRGPSGFTFTLKVENATEAGALAAIIYNDRSGPLTGNLSYITDIPAVGIPQTEGSDLLALLAAGPVTVHLTVNAVVNDTSQNVVGTLVGLQPEQGIVYIGGHYDSVRAGPGANDDASGVAAMLEAARVLGTKGHRAKATLKFIAFGSEETGLRGSRAYVDANSEEVATQGLGMVNLDMIAVGDYLRIGNMDETFLDPIEGYAVAKADLMGVSPWVYYDASCNSDHCYFERAGIPAVFFITWPDPNYHTSRDTLDKISLSWLEGNGELATAVLYDWAKNPVLRAKKEARAIDWTHDMVLEVPETE